MQFSDFEYRTIIPSIQGGYVRTGVEESSLPFLCLLLADSGLHNAHKAPHAFHEPFQRDRCIADTEETWLCSMACVACTPAQNSIIFLN